MIYMRNKNKKQQDQGQQLVKRMILDEIKQKITIVQPKRVTNPTENTESVKGKVLYSIGGAYEKKVPPTKFQDQRICQSIVVEEGRNPVGSGFYSRAHHISLDIQKCIDIKIVNIFDSKEQLEACMTMAEQCKKQAQRAREDVQRYKKEMERCRKDNENCRKEIDQKREEIHRLTTHNQELMNLLLDMEKSRKEDYVQMSRKRDQKKLEIMAEQSEESCQTQQNELTPIDTLDEGRYDSEKYFPSKTVNFSCQQHFQDLLNHKESRINNLQLQKQYMSDQLMALEKDVEEHQIALRNVNEEKNRIAKQLNMVELRCQRLQKQLEVSQAELNVVNDQADLQKERIRQLQSTSGAHHRSIDKSRYLEVPQTSGQVTIETLLKFLKRKQLSKYHEALMELINRYEYQLAELKSSYMEEKELRDRFLKHSQRVYALATSCPPLTLSELIHNIVKFEEEIQHLRQNQIDILLRKVKSYSIGIDPSEFDNIRVELEEYVYQLQARLPILSEEYFEDGSSVADSVVSVGRSDI